MIVVASLGGLPPLCTLLAGLPADYPVPLLVVRHQRPSERPDPLPWLLAKHSALPVRAARQNAFAHRPGVTVIPSGSAGVIEAGGCLRLRERTVLEGSGLTDGDALLASAAAAYAPGPVIGVVLSGMLHDGTDGIRAVKRNGGRVLAQDPATAKARQMPASAIATGCVDFILRPERMAAALICLAMAPGGAQLLTVPLPHWAKLGA